MRPAPHVDALLASACFGRHGGTNRPARPRSSYPAPRALRPCMPCTSGCCCSCPLACQPTHTYYFKPPMSDVLGEQLADRTLPLPVPFPLCTRMHACACTHERARTTCALCAARRRRARTLPCLASTALLSPALATASTLPSCTATSAVVPSRSPRLRNMARIASSTCMHAGAHAHECAPAHA